MKRDPEIVNAAFPLPRGTSEGVDWLLSMMEPRPTKAEIYARWIQERYEAEVKLLPVDVIEARVSELSRVAEEIRIFVEGSGQGSTPNT